MRRNTAKLIQAVVYHRLENRKKKKDKIKGLLKEFFGIILKKYNAELEASSHLTGENISIVDI